jgi:hypothetical protein
MWSGPAGVAVLVIVLGVLGGVIYLVMRTWGSMPPPRGGQEPDTRDVQRDIPPNPG